MNATKNDNPPRRLLQFRLSTLIWVMVWTALLLGVNGYWMRRLQQRQLENEKLRKQADKAKMEMLRAMEESAVARDMAAAVRAEHRAVVQRMRAEAVAAAQRKSKLAPQGSNEAKRADSP